MHIKKGDTIKVIAGDDKGKTGKVVRALPQENKVVIEGVNMTKRHQRPKQEGQKGQVIERAMPIDASKVVKQN